MPNRMHSIDAVYYDKCRT